jgi:hypothetical protein
MDPDTKLYLDEKFGDVDKKLSQLNSDISLMNGRVSNLEQWKIVMDTSYKVKSEQKMKAEQQLEARDKKLIGILSLIFAVIVIVIDVVVHFM